MGGGDLYLTTAPWTRQPPNLWNIFDLLNTQPYLNFVGLHDGEYISHNLDAFRGVGTQEDNIASRHCRAFGLPDDVINLPWLTVPNPRRVARVIFNRTARYRNPLFPWQAVVDKYRDQTAFVGTLEEYWNFTAQFGYVRRLKTANLLEVAEVIAGADLFVGNQSCPCAIAEGLKKPIVQETSLSLANCRFERDGFQSVTDGTINLIDLCEISQTTRSAA
jgi:hypothetical protein